MQHPVEQHAESQEASDLRQTVQRSTDTRENNALFDNSKRIHQEGV